MSEKKLKGLVISGPTGVGKTNLSIELAKKLGCDIISADSMQVYKEMNIGTAKISKDEMQGIKHHMIDIKTPKDDYSVGDFEEDVNKILKEKEQNTEDVIIVGGTGLYLRAITDGFSNLPSKNDKIRQKLDEIDTESLADMLKELDEEAHGQIDLNNRLRLIRAIEVCKLTGQKYSELRTKNIKGNNYKFLKVFLTRDRDEIYYRIDQRVDKMIEDGLVEEAKKIYTNYREHLYKISAIGYKELFDHFDGIISLEEAIEEIKQESRRYAKRQLTWFRKEEDYIVYNLSEMSEEKIMDDILDKWNKI